MIPLRGPRLLWEIVLSKSTNTNVGRLGGRATDSTNITLDLCWRYGNSIILAKAVCKG